MATNFLVHEKIWLDKFKYDHAERRFYQLMNGPVAGASGQEKGPGASSSSLRGVVQELQPIISKLEARLNVLGKSSPGHRTQHMSSMRQVEHQAKKPATLAEDDEDDDIDMFGSDSEEEDKKAAQLREERLQQYAKKPALGAKSSIMLDVKPWDDEMDMLDGLVWGASKLVPVGYGIWKLQIQCVVEDKVGTDLLKEEITKFEQHVQSVDITAFNKI
uniref:Elongation factor 1-delta n=1 Tax=Colobus angolensis palliatus TaxID=336983 RepID=A0A2K5JDR6_COLAP